MSLYRAPPSILPRGPPSIIPLVGKTALITGGSRGIGLAIGKMLAAQGANVTIAAKTAEPHHTLPGTIHTAVEEIEQAADMAGSVSKALAVQADIRNEEHVQQAIAQTMERFGHLDIVINNASAINGKPTIDSTLKEFDLMNNINGRGSWLVARHALPHLLQSSANDRNPHVLSLAPPIDNDSFKRNDRLLQGQYAKLGAAYPMSKYAMSLFSWAFAMEHRGQVASNTLWPLTMIGTSAMKIVSPDAATEEVKWRHPDIVAETAKHILQQDSGRTGMNYIDEIYLRTVKGMSDEQLHAYSLGGPDVRFEDLAPDFFVGQDTLNLVRELRQQSQGEGEGFRPRISDARRAVAEARRERFAARGDRQFGGGDRQFGGRPPFRRQQDNDEFGLSDGFGSGDRVPYRPRNREFDGERPAYRKRPSFEDDD